MTFEKMCPEENGVFSANTHHKALMENSFSFFKVPGDHWDTLLSPEPAEGDPGKSGRSQPKMRILAWC